MMILCSCSAQRLSEELETQSKLEILEKRIVALERQKYKALADLRSETTTFQKKILREIENFRKSQRFFIEELNKIKNDIQLVTNDNERSQFLVRRNTRRIGNLQKNLGDQVIALDEMRQFFNDSVDSDSESSNKQQSAFRNAVMLYKSKKFKEAKEKFNAFRAEYPDSDLVDDSLYFVGYIHFMEGTYNKATLRFYELLNQFPKSNRINDAKWWLAVALQRSGDINGALDLYKELAELDRLNPIRIKARIRLETLKAPKK